MNKRCETCSHFHPYNTSYEDYGECRESPPRVDPLRLIVNSEFYRILSPVVINQSTMFSVMKKDQYCDKWTD